MSDLLFFAWRERRRLVGCSPQVIILHRVPGLLCGGDVRCTGLYVAGLWRLYYNVYNVTLCVPVSFVGVACTARACV